MIERLPERKSIRYDDRFPNHPQAQEKAAISDINEAAATPDTDHEKPFTKTRHKIILITFMKTCMNNDVFILDFPINQPKMT